MRQVTHITRSDAERMTPQSAARSLDLVYKLRPTPTLAQLERAIEQLRATLALASSDAQRQACLDAAIDAVEAADVAVDVTRQNIEVLECKAAEAGGGSDDPLEVAIAAMLH